MKIFKSIMLLILVSTAFSLPISTGIISFVKWFIVFCIAQIIAWNLYNNFVQYNLKKLKVLKESTLETQGVDIICPCYRETKMFIPIDLHKNNSFRCLECKKYVSVDLKIETALGTESLDLDKEDLELKKALKIIQDKVED